MENKENIEMAKLDKYLPKYYKGYDIDILLGKIDHQQTLTPKESKIINEVMDIYYEKEFKRREESWKTKVKIVNGDKIYPPGTMINNPFLKSLKSKKISKEKEKNK